MTHSQANRMQSWALPEIIGSSAKYETVWTGQDCIDWNIIEYA